MNACRKTKASTCSGHGRAAEDLRASHNPRYPARLSSTWAEHFFSANLSANLRRNVAWRAVEGCVVISVCGVALNSALTLGVTDHTTLAVVLTGTLFVTMWMFERDNAKREEE